MTALDKYRVTLTADERADLEQWVSRGRAAARKLSHARLLLLADDSLGRQRSDDEIVAALGTSPRTVSRVRRQLVTAGFDGASAVARNPHAPTSSRSREISNNVWSNGLAAILPKGAATGPCTC
jgi:hypothetical protein